jgi:hypothetical protein
VGQDILKDYVLPWLPTTATLIGWYVVNLQNNKREARKEERALIDGVKKLVIDLTGQARSYMCAEARDEGVETEIKLKLSQVEIELGRFPRYAETPALVDAVAAFGDAATGADFESATRTARKNSDPEPQALALARNDLLQKLESLFTDRYLR